MNRTCLALALATLVSFAPASSPAGDLVGSWSATVSEKHPDRLQLSIRSDGNGHQSSGFLITGFTGLTRRDIESDTRVPVEFRLEREAGTVQFEGTFRNERGAGDFRFVPDPKVADRLRSLGVQLGTKHKNDASELLTVALLDVSIGFIRSMQAIGYDEPLDQYVAFRIFGVDPQYVREMEELGFRRLSAEKLVATKIHGATPDYIREMREEGEDLPIDDYIQSRIFQVTPEFAAEMARAGYPNVPREAMVQFKIHGVTPEFVAELRDLGYSRVPAEKLVAMRIHGVTPAFIRQAAKNSGRRVPVDRLIEMRIFGLENARDDDED